ncbi:hypothetical protein EV360DRAFT_75883, partial [Lentinula raphanica]
LAMRSGYAKSYVGSSSWQNSRTLDFVLLIHRRAFRKLGWRIQEFFTRWGKSPFLIIQDAIRPTTFEASSEYTIEFFINDWMVLNTNNFPFFENCPTRDEILQSRKVHVDSQNIEPWIGGFLKLFDEIQKSFPPPTKRPNPIPTVEEVIVGVYCIQCLVKLKAIVEFILKVPGVAVALSQYGMSPLEEPQSYPEADSTITTQKFKDTQLHKDSLFPSVRANSKNEASGASNNTEAENNADQDEAEEGEDPNDLRSSVPEPDLSVQETSRFLQSISTITAWYVSVVFLVKRARTLFNKQMKTVLFSCPEIQLPEYDAEIQTKLVSLYPNMAFLAGEESLQKRENCCDNAKVHAESALVAWLLRTDVAIATSKKCCYLCWKLREKLNGRGSINFDLPGTHNNISAWVPPPGVPEEILVELRNDLIAILEELDRGDSGLDLDDSEGFIDEGIDLKSIMDRLWSNKIR